MAKPEAKKGNELGKGLGFMLVQAGLSVGIIMGIIIAGSQEQFSSSMLAITTTRQDGETLDQNIADFNALPVIQTPYGDAHVLGDVAIARRLFNEGTCGTIGYGSGEFASVFDIAISELLPRALSPHTDKLAVGILDKSPNRMIDGTARIVPFGDTRTGAVHREVVGLQDVACTNREIYFP